ncbi:MAG: hypothetical protein H0X11_04940 [Betaproteobacteria bacterium]|nr:hypothetical protein [Betaproteobacteria bacterium]
MPGLRRRLHVAVLSLIFAAPALALAQEDADAAVRIARTWTLDVRELVAQQAAQPAHGLRRTHLLRLEMAVQSGTRWASDAILAATRRAAAILSQCGVQTIAYLHEFDGPRRYRNLSSPASRQLADKMRLGRPAIFFVDDTLHRPAFDAEAIGRGNSATRPEMTDTVWITAATRDLPIALAHELVHVLTDSGAHSDAADNLMREETAASNTQLTTEQCVSVLRTGVANGLLECAGGNDVGN